MDRVLYKVSRNRIKLYFNVSQFCRNFPDANIEIASRDAAADPSRRSNIITPYMTLDDLTDRLKQFGFLLSRSATYLQLVWSVSHVNFLLILLLVCCHDDRIQLRESDMFEQSPYD